MDNKDIITTLDTAHDQLTTIQIDFTRLTHNLDAIIANVDKVIAELKTEGEAN